MPPYEPRSLQFPRRVPRFGVVLWLAVAWVPQLVHASAEHVDAASVERYMGHVEFLAAPEMRGRGAGMPELDQAAEYIAQKFRDAGLAPAGASGSFLQPFEVTTGARMGNNNSLTVQRKRGTSELKLDSDFVPINFSSSGEVEGEVVFAGYGATAEEFGYDDYAHFDASGKIVLLLRYEPEFFGVSDSDEQGESRGGRRYTRHSHLIAKAIQARNRGAKAVLLVNGRRGVGKGDRLIRFGSVSGPSDAGIPMVHVKNRVVEQWLRGSGRSLRLLQRDIDASEQPQSFALASSLRVRLAVDVEHERALVNNVAGYLPGVTDQYVVIGAHYDHLGLGDQSSLAPSRIGEVHPGADDNASGVAAILELARSYAARSEQLRRGILFLAFAGEEIGLLGSSYWVEHPTLALDNAVAMFNFDMVGRIQAGKLYVGGIGTADPFASMVERAAASHSLRIDTSRSAASSSDHTSFAAKKIPVMFFFSGLHSDYHKPGDTADKIDAVSAMKLLGLAADLVDEVSGMPEKLVFVESSSQASHPQGRATDTSGGGYGPWFGSVPDFGEVPEGVKFADVRAGSPAGQAGLRSGDILTHWNDAPIQNLYDFTYALRDSEVGEVVVVRFLRDGKELTANVKLAERP